MAQPGRRAEGWVRATARPQNSRPGFYTRAADKKPNGLHIFAGLRWIYRAFARDGPSTVFPQR